MACILMPQCNFVHRYFRCLLPEETVDIEVKVKTMKGIHTFRRDCTTQIIYCKPWHPRAKSLSILVRILQTYVELKDQDANQPHSSSNQAAKPTSLQKAPVSKKAVDKKQKKRRKMSIRKQFKVRPAEKPLSHTTKTEAITTTATATQSSMTEPTATSTTWPTAKPTQYH